MTITEKIQKERKKPEKQISIGRNQAKKFNHPE